jgi:hypothetical protein
MVIQWLKTEFCEWLSKENCHSIVIRFSAQPGKIVFQPPLFTILYSIFTLRF